jgi:hypothetical protein
VLNVEHDWLSYFEQIVKSLYTLVFLVSVLGSTPNHTPLKYRCPNKKSNRIRFVYLNISVVFLLGMVLLIRTLLIMQAVCVQIVDTIVDNQQR